MVGLTGRDITCAWSSDAYGVLHFELLAGGSWGVAGMSPVSPGDATYGRTPYLPIEVPGVTSTKASCGSGTCDAFLTVGTSAVEIVYNDPGTAKNPALLAALAKVIASS